MSAAHLRAPDVPAATFEFVPRCTGRPRHTQAEAVAVVMRRGIGHARRCSVCGSWHTALPPRLSTLKPCLPHQQRTAK